MAQLPAVNVVCLWTRMLYTGTVPLSRSLVFLGTASLMLILMWNFHGTQASISHYTGKCAYKSSLFKPGQTFTRGCDKCICHHDGFMCASPMKPTFWPRKCQRIPMECGYRVVYQDNPKQQCRAYSYIW